MLDEISHIVLEGSLVFLLLINGLSSKLPEADNRALSFKECSSERLFFFLL